MWHLNMDLNWWGVNVVVVILSCKNKFTSDGEDSFNVTLLLDKLFLPVVRYGLKQRFEDRWALTVYQANLYNDFESRFINKTWPGQILATTFVGVYLKAENVLRFISCRWGRKTCITGIYNGILRIKLSLQNITLLKKAKSCAWYKL